MIDPLCRLIQESLAHMPPEKHAAFKTACNAATAQALREVVENLSKDAFQCSNGGWDEIKGKWRNVRQEYAARHQELELERTAARLGPAGPELPEATFQAIAWVSEQGKSEDLRALEQVKKTAALPPEEAELINRAITSIEKREVEPAVNFYILTCIGDALIPDVANAFGHADGLFVSVFHKGARRLEGILDVSHDGEAIEWYPREEARPCEGGLELDLLVPGTQARRGRLRFQSDGKVLAWRPAAAQAGP
jgi:hypothetical protein